MSSCGRLFVGLSGSEAQQQPEGVTVGGDGVGAGAALAGQPVGEERLQSRRECGHGRAPKRLSRRAAANSISSGSSGQVPVGARRVDMSEVGGQDRHPALDLDPGSMPLDQGADSETVPQIMDTWPDRRRAQADVGGELRGTSRRTGLASSAVPRLETKNVADTGVGHS